MNQYDNTFDAKDRRLSDALSKITRSSELTSGNLVSAAKIITKIAANAIGNIRVGIWHTNYIGNFLKSVICYDSRTDTFSVQDDFNMNNFREYINKLNIDRVIKINDLTANRDDKNVLSTINNHYDTDVFALLDSPVLMDGELVGVVCVEHFDKPYNWSVAEENFASSLADFVALAMISSERLNAIMDLNLNKKRIDSLMSNLPGMVYQCLCNPPDYTFTFVSAGSYALTGYTPEELTNNNALKFFDMIHPDDNERLQKENEKTLNIGLPLETSFRIIMRDGTVKWIWERSIVVEFKEDGTPHALEGFYTDITEQRRLEAAELANRTKGDFLANISHEIRTPMNAIIGLSNIAIKQKPQTQTLGCLFNIKNAANSLLAIINDILDFSKMETGSLNIVPESYYMESFINDIATLINAKLDKKEVEFIVEDSPNLPRILIGDIKRIKQIIINLLSNAIKFTTKGHIKLILWTEPILNNKVLLKAGIEDTGIGIKNEDLSMLFTAFNQIDANRNRSMEGTGLGLAIVQSLIDRMGGTISVKSKYGEGSCFSFEIPQRTDDMTPLLNKNKFSKYHVGISFNCLEKSKSLYEKLVKLGAKCVIFEDIKSQIKDMNYLTHVFLDYNQLEKFDSSTMPKTYFIANSRNYFEGKNYGPNVSYNYMPLTSISISRLLDNNMSHNYGKEKNTELSLINIKFLVVDDNKINLLVAKKTFESYGADVDIVLSGEEAIDIIQNKKYDMIFMDHMMPKMDGVETTVLMRSLQDQQFRTIPIVALTANAVEGVKDLFIEAGMNDYLSKPIIISEFERIVRQWLPTDKWKFNKISENAE